MGPRHSSVDRAVKRPVIGVTSARNRGRIMWWFNWFAVRRAGGKPVKITPATPISARELDGLVVGSGDDIGFSLYWDQPNMPVLQPDIRIDTERDALERDLICDAWELGLPVLGICRGAQMINVALGGNLHTDIYQQFQDLPRMRTPLPRKRVHVEKGSRLYKILGSSECRVNSLHHQSTDRLGNGLAVVSRDAHNIVQAIEQQSAPFLIGVQWHPEFLVFDTGQVRLFRRLVVAARDHRDRS